VPRWSCCACVVATMCSRRRHDLRAAAASHVSGVPTSGAVRQPDANQLAASRVRRGGSVSRCGVCVSAVVRHAGCRVRKGAQRNAARAWSSVVPHASSSAGVTL
jgi:hypothetical protein